MTPSGVAPSAPRINALQQYWLREIGIEKTWLPAAELPAQALPMPGPQHQGASAAATPPDVPLGTDAVGRGRARPAGAMPPGASGDSAAGVAIDGQPAGRPAAGASQSPSVGNATDATTKRPQVNRPVVPTPRLAPGTSTPTPVFEPVVPAADFDALREQVTQCTACGLCQGRRHAVFGMGARPAHWMVIGEAPGEQEDRKGLPFVGRSGQLLDAMLSAVGMSREKDVFIANVIKCRPPGNRNPKPEEIAACSPYLRQQIELIQPEKILVVGRFAAQTLLGTDASIGSLRGRQHVWTMENGRQIPVIVSYHPAYLLRSPGEKARAWQDLQLALSTPSE